MEHVVQQDPFIHPSAGNNWISLKNILSLFHWALYTSQPYRFTLRGLSILSGLLDVIEQYCFPVQRDRHRSMTLKQDRDIPPFKVSLKFVSVVKSWRD